MDAWLQALGLAAAVLSAVAFYAGSTHCLWPRLRGRPRLARGLGCALAVLSLAAWMHALGAAGACAMLACWMLALAAQPWLALLACSCKGRGVVGEAP
ncbi:hypothetical protein [Frateuria sp. STR12]|uniref:hypothetical protein n=1 Tax=Frateuria hangzhouensis TaxID=2995589 RepID=UPI002260E068|nr:hypothetical protein [Frateuria sp. STR12]MCX7515384.1 hypothetical protein [Frateuria sp. STR12]